MLLVGVSKLSIIDSSFFSRRPINSCAGDILMSGKRVILTHFLLLLDQSPLLLQDCGILLICRTLYLLTESALLSHCWTFFMGLIITTSTTFIFGLASLRFLLFTFNSWTHLFCMFLLFYGIHSWLHPSIVFSGSVNSFRGFDQFQPLFQASILWPNRDTFPDLLCTCADHLLSGGPVQRCPC